jgi:RimJ/RimL family protein N-acetyltransferase
MNAAEGPSQGSVRSRFSTIRTQRLALRDLESGDAQRLLEYRSKPAVSRFQSWGTHSISEIREYLGRLSTIEPGMPGIWYQVAITLLPGDRLIGDCGFRVDESETRHVEFGITLDPEYESQGYATEALRALLDYLLVTLGKHRVFGSVDPENDRSIRLMSGSECGSKRTSSRRFGSRMTGGTT